MARCNGFWSPSARGEFDVRLKSWRWADVQLVHSSPLRKEERKTNGRGDGTRQGSIRDLTVLFRVHVGSASYCFLLFGRFDFVLQRRNMQILGLLILDFQQGVYSYMDQWKHLDNRERETLVSSTFCQGGLQGMHVILSEIEKTCDFYFFSLRDCGFATQ